MKTFAISAFISTLSLVMAPLASHAQGTPSPTQSAPSKNRVGGMSFLDLDRDLNGQISLDEASGDPALLQHFKQADTNHNSEIDASEFAAFVAKNQGKEQEGGQTGQRVSFESLDANGDGKVSANEAKADPSLAEQFNSADQNGDGSISPAEFSAFESNERNASAQGGASSPQTGTRQPGASAQPQTGAPAPAVTFQSLDSDNNGWISPKEASADPALSRQFQNADKDRNGFLDGAEFSAWESAQEGGASQ